MRKHVKRSVLGLMVLGIVFCSASLVTATSFTIGLVDGDWINAIPNVSITNSGNSGGLSTARWGVPAGNPYGQSGYDFQSVTTPFSAQSDGTLFALGDFTHQNYPIYETFLESIDLRLNLGIQGLGPINATFYFQHNETQNNYYPPDDPRNNDIVKILNPIVNIPFTYNGDDYYFNLVGFYHDGSVSSTFSTVEGLRNTATLYAQITEAPVTGVPEPASMLLLGSGLVGMAAFRRKFLG